MTKRNNSVSLDDVHNETLSLFHRLIGRLEKLTVNCEDPGTINQALKTTADFLVKLNKERESGDDEIGTLLQQPLHAICYSRIKKNLHLLYLTEFKFCFQNLVDIGRTLNI